MPGTLGTPAVVKLTRTLREAIALGFVADKVFGVGVPVQMQSDGTVDQVTVGQKTLGYVYKPNKAIGEEVTILTPFIMVVDNAQVGTAALIATGDLVKINAAQTQTNGKATFDVAASTNVATGICLKGGAIGATIQVGILITPVLAP